MLLMRSLLLLILVLSGCEKASVDSQIAYPDGAIVLTVEGMHCGSCKAKVVRALAKVDGVEWAQVEYESGEVAFMGDAKIEEVVEAIREAGYSAEGRDDSRL